MRRPGRIIPARAGFTSARPPPPSGTPDHPRSRGVYQPRARHEAIRQGSSPLARGLRPPDDDHRRILGIIPARAGFTPAPDPRAARDQDHPRSRGVYCLAPGPLYGAHGSSPLARGLLRAPARKHGCGRDHPRSRGVYSDLGPRVGRGLGSSPLARGLPELAAEKAIGVRIIPARAGFTGRSSGFPTMASDHPRSRGVYRGRRRRSPRAGGSSPLARGLLMPSATWRAAHGIIPARAGFTRRLLGRGRGPADHPRSRGVYAAGRARRRQRHGSSPLARGLPGGSSSPTMRGRIIPARAGFTGRSPT